MRSEGTLVALQTTLVLPHMLLLVARSLEVESLESSESDESSEAEEFYEEPYQLER